jgi:nucleoside-diphosphate-sugar epimerase
VAKITETILVLGAGGRLGFTAAEAFRDAGWTVKGLVRPKKSHFVPKGVTAVEAVTREEAVEAAKGCDVVLNAFNPVITEWQKSALSLAYAAIAAAESNGATLMFPGSVWNFGEGMPPVIDETTPQNATTRKGQMRVEMEQRIREACDRGMRAIVLRGADYFGAGRGSWFDLVVTKEMNRSRLTYPGPSDVVHEWTYLPDFADTLVRLAGRRAEFAACETFGFPGHAITGADLVKAIEAETKKVYNVRRMSWWMLKTVGQLSTVGRELSELEYLWRVPHRISGDKLKGVLGEVPHTSLDRAIGRSLRALGLT